MPEIDLEFLSRKLIEQLVKEEHRLLSQCTVADLDEQRLREIHVEFDQCLDTLRQSPASRERRQSPEWSWDRLWGIATRSEG